MRNYKATDVCHQVASSALGQCLHHTTHLHRGMIYLQYRHQPAAVNALLNWLYLNQRAAYQAGRVSAHSTGHMLLLRQPMLSQELYRPASTQDLLEGPELEQRMADDGRLPDILSDPELMPDWQAQLGMQLA